MLPAAASSPVIAPSPSMPLRFGGRSHVPCCKGVARGAMRNGSRGQNLAPFSPEYRASGLLLHVTSLPSPYGIGDLGPGAFAWVDRLHEAGQSWWQALPLG